MSTLHGRCHCGNLQLAVALPREPGNYTPRACDCDFCRMHGAAYISDPDGALTLKVADESRLSRYRQGSGTAEFLLCRDCGVLVAVVYENSDGERYANVNCRCIQGEVDWGQEQTASPKVLAAGEKTTRWQSLWFSSVEIT